MTAMRLGYKFLYCVFLAATFALSGCFPSGTREAQSFHVLEPAGTAPKAPAPREATLLVEPMTAAPFYDTQSIVFSRSPGTRGYYQFASFTQAPARTLGERLAARLEQSGAFRDVALDARGPRPALRLRTHLEELYHEAAQAPGRVRVVLTAELYDPASGARIARRTFTGEEPAPTFDARGAVTAFNAATGRLLDEMIAWVDREAPR